MTRLAHMLLASMLAVSGGTVSASAADMVMVNYSDPGICAKSEVLGRITNRFAHQVRHVPNLPQVGIVDFQRIGETRHLPRVKSARVTEERPIDRRYCHATVGRQGARRLVPDRKADGLCRHWQQCRVLCVGL
jgi:hypothetical protein